MTGRLVAAQVWRIRWSLLPLVFFGASGAIQSTVVGTRLMMGMPLMFAATAISGLGMFWSRDVRVLPIPQRVALRSAWLSAVALPVAIMTGRLVAALTQLAFGSALTVSFETMGLAAVWDATYIGMSLAIGQLPDTPWTGLRQAFGTLRVAGRMLLSVLWLIVPFAGPELVPQAVVDVGWMHIAGVLVGVVVTAWPLVAKPDQWPMLGVLHDAPREGGVEPARREHKHRAFDRLDRFVGMRRLLPGQVGTAVLVSGLTLAASTALTFSLRSVQSPFAAGMGDMEFFLIGGPLFLLMLGPIGWTGGLTPVLRRLKSLPVSAMQIAVTMTSLPLMTPLFFWIFAIGVHLFVGVPGDGSWRLGSFALLCGILALSGALHARFKSHIVMMVGSMAPAFGVLTLMMFFDKVAVEPVIAFWFPVVGLIGVPSAFLLNYWTVTRGSSSSAAYRPGPGGALYRGGRP